MARAALATSVAILPAMSQENVEVVRSMLAAYGAGDIEAVVSVADAEIELRPAVVGGPEGTVYRGPEGVRAFFADIAAAWERFAIEAEDFRDVGDTVLVLGRSSLVARDGMALDAKAGWVFGVRNGRITRFDSFLSRDEALEAVGLRE
jgi:ketosteroid isomerase-like protein